MIMWMWHAHLTIMRILTHRDCTKNQAARIDDAAVGINGKASYYTRSPSGFPRLYSYQLSSP